MDDIFYLSTMKIDLKDIGEEAKAVKVKSILIPKFSEIIEIEYQEGVIASWAKMSVKEFRETEDAKFLIDNEIESVFCISHHNKDLHIFLPHIRNLLGKYGGWIGNDNSGFQPYYNLENIEILG